MAVINPESKMTVSEEIKGLIFDIQQFSTNDGPGVRTTVFLKGCPLRCFWCDNPESQTYRSQLFYFKSLCTKCYRCTTVCSTGATTIDTKGDIRIDHKLCQACGECIKACSTEARVMSGNSMTVDEVFKVVKKDSLFYLNSGGGVTASGGEATSQPEFLIQLFRRCQEAGIHTALETCGHVTWDTLVRVLDNTDLVLFDIKHMDSTKHKELTGVDNNLILQNAEKIAASGKAMVLRVPLIPGCNDTDDNIRAVGDFARRIECLRVDILPYHQLGVQKYERLGENYSLNHIKPYHEEEVGKLKGILESYGLEVLIA
jgi:glycyl-radical enzyme activating protein